MIGKRIQKIRKSKGMTLSDCAERANISKSYLSNIERNLNQNPSIQIIERIATVLGVNVTSLISVKALRHQEQENEWMEFIRDLKASGVEAHELQELRAVIEFAKWQKRKKVEN